MRQRFWVYENWTVDRARVHNASCGFCNHGKGVRSNASTQNGKWHGPYATRALAIRQTIQLGRADARQCPFCL